MWEKREPAVKTQWGIILIAVEREESCHSVALKKVRKTLPFRQQPPLSPRDDLKKDIAEVFLKKIIHSFLWRPQYLCGRANFHKAFWDGKRERGREIGLLRNSFPSSSSSSLPSFFVPRDLVLDLRPSIHQPRLQKSAKFTLI